MEQTLMKPNRLQQALSEGRIPVGHMILEFGTRGLAQILATAGLDFAIIDMEHTSFSMNEVANLIAWFKATPVAPMVRIPQIERHFIARIMDAGALGIMVPDVRNAAQLQAVVELVKYPPLGKRGPALGLAQSDFKRVDAMEFMEFSNRNTTIICQIESPQGVDNLEAIASVPGLDVLWVGHFDLSQTLGILGQFSHETFLGALRQIVAAAKKHGLAMGGQPRSLAQAGEWVTMGFDVISFSSDVNVYRDAMSAAVEGVSKLNTREATT
jgi:2-dehydro-3-deoxyglucarate aldolase/4-hydroxy-2-oxoheptanedioate aldolase